MFDILKTRKGKLQDKISTELGKSNPSLNNIVAIVDEYEASNIDTIEKLRRKKLVDVKKINGALKQTIHAHGPITKELIGSASKRIYGALMDDKKNNNLIKRIIKFFTWNRK